MPSTLEDGGHQVVCEEDGVEWEDREAVEGGEERDGEGNRLGGVRLPIEVAAWVDVTTQHSHGGDAE